MATSGGFVHVKEAVVITPSDPTPSRVLSLSSLDSQLFLRFTIEYLLVFNNSPRPRPNRDQITARVRSALARVLVPYYPLAGRVRAAAAARPDGSNLEVVCRAQGAVFVEAISNHTVDEFETAPTHVTQWRNLLSLHVSDVLKGAPPLVVQLTWLSDGAAALGVGINHCLCDGIGSAEFLNSFAELAIGRHGLGTEFKPKPKPVWDRHILNSLPGPGPRIGSATATHPEFNPVQDLCGFVNRFNHERLRPTSVTFDRTSLNELKKLASRPSESSSSSFTSFEVLTGHVWRSWARSLDLPPNQILKLLFSVNVRNRVYPNIPNGYYGNGFVLGCAQTSVKELVQNGSSYASNLVKRAKERVGEDYVRRVIESVSESRTCPDSVGVLIVSQWSRLGLERVDFGMGRPVHVGPICSDKYCLLLPVTEGSEAVKVMVALPTNAVDMYEYLLKNPDS